MRMDVWMSGSHSWSKGLPGQARRLPLPRVFARRSHISLECQASAETRAARTALARRAFQKASPAMPPREGALNGAGSLVFIHHHPAAIIQSLREIDPRPLQFDSSEAGILFSRPATRRASHTPSTNRCPRPISSLELSDPHHTRPPSSAPGGQDTSRTCVISPPEAPPEAILQESESTRLALTGTGTANTHPLKMASHSWHPGLFLDACDTAYSSADGWIAGVRCWPGDHAPATETTLAPSSLLLNSRYPWGGGQLNGLRCDVLVSYCARGADYHDAGPGETFSVAFQP